MSVQKRFINRVALYVLLIWTIIVGSVEVFLVYKEYQDAIAIAKHEAIVNVRKDLAYRTWVASHGGVYVPITEKTPPNPYLSHIKNRDVNTTSGQHLTLMNPAYTLSQTMHDYAKQFGIKGHITSKKLLNPKNAPDEWEKRALNKIEKTKSPEFEVVTDKEDKYLRYLNPLITKLSCLKCHASQGYKVGDLRGGVSVSIPMNGLYNDAFNNSLQITLALFVIWMIGFMAIIFGRKFVLKELERKIRNYEQNIFSMVSIIEKRDRYTAGHTQRVADYSVLIAKEMGYSEKDLDELYRACMLHDIGKISTPDVILLKPGNLSKIEREIIQEHVVSSYDILKQIDIYKEIAEIVRYHHERYDGEGYPYKLKGDQVPISSQIMTLADAFDAMTTNRIYKARKSIGTALTELEDLSGTQFNPDIVKKALIALKDVKVDLDINQIPQTTLEKQRFAYFYSDPITEMYNREYLEYMLTYNHVNLYNLRCVHNISLKHFSKYNKKHGWDEGDKILKKVGKVLKDITGEDGFVFRIFGDNFTVLNKKHLELEKHLYKIDNILKDKDISYVHKHYDMQKDHIHSINDLERVI